MWKGAIWVWKENEHVCWLVYYETPFGWSSLGLGLDSCPKTKREDSNRVRVALWLHHDHAHDVDIHLIKPTQPHNTTPSSRLFCTTFINSSLFFLLLYSFHPPSEVCSIHISFMDCFWVPFDHGFVIFSSFSFVSGKVSSFLSFWFVGRMVVLNNFFFFWKVLMFFLSVEFGFFILSLTIELSSVFH